MSQLSMAMSMFSSCRLRRFSPPPEAASFVTVNHLEFRLIALAMPPPRIYHTPLDEPVPRHRARLVEGGVRVSMYVPVVEVLPELSSLEGSGVWFWGVSLLPQAARLMTIRTHRIIARALFIVSYFPFFFVWRDAVPSGFVLSAACACSSPLFKRVHIVPG